MKQKENGVKERPILFSGEMVQAILSGRKSQTRRVVKPQPPNEWEYDTRGNVGFVLREQPACFQGGKYWQYGAHWGSHPRLDLPFPDCPYGVPGDTLYVRESFWAVDSPYFNCAHFLYEDEFEQYDKGTRDEYEAGQSWAHRQGHDFWDTRACGLRYGHIPSIHMPRWASRITLEITDVRVERLQEISEADAIAEGAERYSDAKKLDEIDRLYLTEDTHRHGFAALWDSLNAKRGFSWESNPWVWRIEFKPLSAPNQKQTGSKL